ncbi:MAG: hypothetical protein ACFE0Q_06210 [Anaerolineae bacterium]
MLLKYLQYRYVKLRLPAYLRGDLPAHTRRFIARQIDENPLCQRAYRQARAGEQLLERTLPIIGKPSEDQLDAIWTNIQAELQQPAPTSITRSNYSFSYGMAVVVLCLLMLSPLTMATGTRALDAPLPEHPLPERTVSLTTPASTPSASGGAVTLLVDHQEAVQSTRRSTIPLQNTPAPHTPGI